MRRLRYLHPFFVALLPVVSLLAHNVHELQISTASRSLLVFAALAVVFVLVARLVAGNWGRGALLASLLILVTTSYGDVYAVLKQHEIAGVILGRHRYLLPLSLISVLSGAWVIRHSESISRSLHSALTLASLGALLIPLAQIGSFLVQSPPFQGTEGQQAAASAPSASVEIETRPDIYYIVLDSYARADTLQKWFDYDNSVFLDALKARGFYVADRSNSNYFGSGVSLASSLNMNYLQDLDMDLTQGIYPSNMRDPIQNSRVRRELESLDYSTVAFPTDYPPTDLVDADYYLQPGVTPLQKLHITGRLSNFESLLVRGTIAQVVLDLQILRESKIGSFVRGQLDEPRQQRRAIVLSTLEHLESVPHFEEPTFTFAHMVIPHKPYIFDRDGELVSTERLQNRPGSHIADNNHFYLDQLIYTSELIMETIDTILAKSDSPPIIILQADHGPEPDMDWDNPDQSSLKARMGILNAYLVPEECKEGLYPAISPVNSFRLIFDCLGIEEARLLPDRSYYSNLHSRSEKLNFMSVEALFDD